MLLDADQCYRALRAHDTRFDGRFFVGVGTTRIYCRPVCTVRTPHSANCRFFQSAARPRPRASGRACAAVPSSRRLRRRRRESPPRAGGANLMEDGRLGRREPRRPRLGAARHRPATCAASSSRSSASRPVEYAQTQRLLLAKRLLTDTDLAVIDRRDGERASRACGRFNALFRDALSHDARASLRRSSPGRASTDRLAFDLAYRPPYDWPRCSLSSADARSAASEAVDARRLSPDAAL
jgi:AraC family transcriptional regulator of adaptative response / DNA-3-methyladenine glycosylase II